MTSPLPRQLQLVDRDALIIAHCTERRVLHLGCTASPGHVEDQKAGRLLHEKLIRKASCLCGVDIDRDALAWLEERFPDQDFLVGDIEDRDFMLTLKGVTLT